MRELSEVKIMWEFGGCIQALGVYFKGNVELFRAFNQEKDNQIYTLKISLWKLCSKWSVYK